MSARERVGLGVVVNTDAALVDPDWDVFAAEHERRFGLAISHLKSLVRGTSYDNEVMKVRVGATDGTRSEVKSKQLAEGDRVIVNAVEAAK